MKDIVYKLAKLNKTIYTMKYASGEALVNEFTNI